MSPKAAKILVALSLVGFVIGGLMLNMIWVGYRPADLPPALGVTGAALVAFSLGIGRLKRGIVGLGIFVVGVEGLRRAGVSGRAPDRGVWRRSPAVRAEL
jgi:hypothetical protein